MSTEKLPTNREYSSVDFATRNHRTRTSGYALVGPRSRAGGVKRRNHFTTTDPKCEYMLKSDFPQSDRSVRYRVMVNGKKVASFANNSQAQSRAAQLGGYVSIL